MDQAQTVNTVVDTTAADAAIAARQNLNFLAALCMGDKIQFPFPMLFLIIWRFLIQKLDKVRDFSQLALGIPRGFAKTTLIKILCVYIVLFTSRKFICIISHTEDHAQNIIKDVCSFLSHPNIIALFGRWDLNVSRDRVECKIFAFRNKKMILAGLGANGSIRGLNVEDERPDVMIFEDFQKKLDSENEELSNKLYKEMYGTFMKSKAPFGCLFIFVANMYPTVGSILKKLKLNKDWISFIVGGIVNNKGKVESLWEDLQPLSQLIKEFQKDLNAGCPEVFFAEVLNDENAGLKSGIDITKLPSWPYLPHVQPDARAIVIDPALDNPSSDYNGIGLVGLYDGVPALEYVDLGRYNPFELIKKAIIIGLKTNCRLITVENVAIQASYLFWFNKICEDNSIEGFIFEPLNIGGGTKNARIAAALKTWHKKDLLVKPEVNAPLTNEIIAWDPKKRNNRDTVLDLLWMALKVVEQYRDKMVLIDRLPFLLGTNVGVPALAETCAF